MRLRRDPAVAVFLITRPDLPIYPFPRRQVLGYLVLARFAKAKSGVASSKLVIIDIRSRGKFERVVMTAPERS